MVAKPQIWRTSTATPPPSNKSSQQRVGDGKAYPPAEPLGAGKRTRASLEVFSVPDAHVRLSAVVAITGLSESTIRRRLQTSDFPAPIRHGKRCTRWIARDVLAWLNSHH